MDNFPCGPPSHNCLHNEYWNNYKVYKSLEASEMLFWSPRVLCGEESMGHSEVLQGAEISHVLCPISGLLLAFDWPNSSGDPCLQLDSPCFPQLLCSPVALPTVSWGTVMDWGSSTAPSSTAISSALLQQPPALCSASVHQGTIFSSCASLASLSLTCSFQKLWLPWCSGPAHLQTAVLLWWQWAMGHSSADHETSHVQPKHVILCPGQGWRLVTYSSMAAPHRGCSRATCGDFGRPWWVPGLGQWWDGSRDGVFLWSSCPAGT